MSKLRVVLLAGTLIGAGASIAVADNMKCHDDMSMHMKAMDTNGDGMISKDEFMKGHEAMWDKMKKDGKGMVSLKEMEMQHESMKSGEMMKGDMPHDSTSPPK